jgi:hypothetical protein
MKPFEETKKKWDDLLLKLKESLRKEDYRGADNLIESLRDYKHCGYCTVFRETVEWRGYRGVCGDCPLHQHGERLYGQPVSYNGCYKIGDYRNLVRSAVWYVTDPSKKALEDVIEKLEIAIVSFENIRNLIT